MQKHTSLLQIDRAQRTNFQALYIEDYIKGQRI